MSYANRRLKAFSGPHGKEAERIRSEARIKDYISAADVRAWSDLVEERRRHILELPIIRNTENFCSSLLPLNLLYNVLLARAGGQTDDLKKKRDRLRALLAIYCELKLTPEQEAELLRLLEARAVNMPCDRAPKRKARRGSMDFDTSTDDEIDAKRPRSSTKQKKKYANKKIGKGFHTSDSHRGTDIMEWDCIKEKVKSGEIPAECSAVKVAEGRKSKKRKPKTKIDQETQQVTATEEYGTATEEEEMPVRPGGPGEPGKQEKPDKPDGQDKSDKSDKSDKPDKTDKAAKPGVSVRMGKRPSDKEKEQIVLPATDAITTDAEPSATPTEASPKPKKLPKKKTKRPDERDLEDVVEDVVEAVEEPPEKEEVKTDKKKKIDKSKKEKSPAASTDKFPAEEPLEAVKVPKGKRVEEEILPPEEEAHHEIIVTGEGLKEADLAAVVQQQQPEKKGVKRVREKEEERPKEKEIERPKEKEIERPKEEEEIKRPEEEEEIKRPEEEEEEIKRPKEVKRPKAEVKLPKEEEIKQPEKEIKQPKEEEIKQPIDEEIKQPKEEEIKQSKEEIKQPEGEDEIPVSKDESLKEPEKKPFDDEKQLVEEVIKRPEEEIQGPEEIEGQPLAEGDKDTKKEERLEEKIVPTDLDKLTPEERVEIEKLSETPDEAEKIRICKAKCSEFYRQQQLAKFHICKAPCAGSLEEIRTEEPPKVELLFKELPPEESASEGAIIGKPETIDTKVLSDIAIGGRLSRVLTGDATGLSAVAVPKTSSTTSKTLSGEILQRRISGTSSEHVTVPMEIDLETDLKTKRICKAPCSRISPSPEYATDIQKDDKEIQVLLKETPMAEEDIPITEEEKETEPSMPAEESVPELEEFDVKQEPEQTLEQELEAESKKSEYFLAETAEPDVDETICRAPCGKKIADSPEPVVEEMEIIQDSFYSVEAGSKEQEQQMSDHEIICKAPCDQIDQTTETDKQISDKSDDEYYDATEISPQEKQFLKELSDTEIGTAYVPRALDVDVIEKPEYFKEETSRTVPILSHTSLEAVEDNLIPRGIEPTIIEEVESLPQIDATVETMQQSTDEKATQIEKLNARTETLQPPIQQQVTQVETLNVRTETLQPPIQQQVTQVQRPEIQCQTWVECSTEEKEVATEEKQLHDACTDVCPAPCSRISYPKDAIDIKKNVEKLKNMCECREKQAKLKLKKSAATSTKRRCTCKSSKYISNVTKVDSGSDGVADKSKNKGVYKTKVCRAPCYAFFRGGTNPQFSRNKSCQASCAQDKTGQASGSASKAAQPETQVSLSTKDAVIKTDANIYQVTCTTLPPGGDFRMRLSKALNIPARPRVNVIVKNETHEPLRDTIVTTSKLSKACTTGNRIRKSVSFQDDKSKGLGAYAKNRLNVGKVSKTTSIANNKVVSETKVYRTGIQKSNLEATVYPTYRSEVTYSSKFHKQKDNKRIGDTNICRNTNIFRDSICRAPDLFADRKGNDRTEKKSLNENKKDHKPKQELKGEERSETENRTYQDNLKDLLSKQAHDMIYYSSLTADEVKDVQSTVIYKDAEILALKNALKAKEAYCVEQRKIAAAAIEKLENIKNIVEERDDLRKKLERSQNELDSLKKNITYAQQQTSYVLKDDSVGEVSQTTETSRESDIINLEREIEDMRKEAQTPDTQAKMIRKEVDVLKQYCSKLSVIQNENSQLKQQLRQNENVLNALGVTDTGSFHQLRYKIEHLNEIVSERDMLKCRADQLEKQLYSYRDLPEDIEVFKQRSMLLDEVLQDRDRLSKRLEELRGVDEEIYCLRKKASRCDELEDQLFKLSKEKVQMEEEIEIFKCRCSYAEIEALNHKADGDGLRSKLACMEHEIESLKCLCKDQERLKGERDELQVNLEELVRMQDNFDDMKMQMKCLDVLRAEKDMYKSKYENLIGLECECDILRAQVERAKIIENERDALTGQVEDLEGCICEQEKEIRRLVADIDELSLGRDNQQDKLKTVLTSMRAELEEKDMLINTSEQKLCAVQEELRNSIQGLSVETSQLRNKNENLEREYCCCCCKIKALEAELASSSETIEQLKKANTKLEGVVEITTSQLAEKESSIQALQHVMKDHEDILNDYEKMKKLSQEEQETAINKMSKDLETAREENRKLQETVQNIRTLSGDAHFQELLKQSKCAVQRICEELSKQYKDWDNATKQMKEKQMTASADRSNRKTDINKVDSYQQCDCMLTGQETKMCRELQCALLGTLKKEDAETVCNDMTCPKKLDTLKENATVCNDLTCPKKLEARKARKRKFETTNDFPSTASISQASSTEPLQCTCKDTQKTDDQLQTLEDRIQQSELELSKANVIILTLKNRLAVDERLTAENEALRRHSSEVQEVAKNEIEDLSDTLTKTRKEAVCYKGQCEFLLKELEELKETRTINAKLKDCLCEQDQKEKDIAKLQCDLCCLHRKKEAEKEEYEKRFVELQNKANMLLKEKEDLENELNQLRKEKEDTDKMLASNIVTSSRRSSKLENELDSVNKNCKKLEDTCIKLEQDKKELTAKCSCCIRASQNLKDKIIELTGQVETLRKAAADSELLEAMKRDNEKLKKENDDLINQFTRPSLLADKVSRSQLDKELKEKEALQSIVADLENQLKNMSQVPPVGPTKSTENMMNELTQRLETEQKRADEAEKAWKNLKANDPTTMLSGKIQKLETKVQQLEDENKKLNEELENVKDANKILDEGNAKLKSGFTGEGVLLDEINELKEKINALEKENQDLKNNLKQCRCENNCYTRRYSKLLDENGKLKMQLVSTESENSKLKKELGNFVTDGQGDRHRLQQIEVENCKLSQKICNLQSDNIRLKNELESALDKAKGNSAYCCQIQAENCMLKQKLVKVSDELAKIKKDFAATSKELAQARCEIKNRTYAMEELTQQSQEAANFAKKLATLKEENGNLKRELESALAEAKKNVEMQQEIAALKQQLAQLKCENNLIKKQLEDALADLEQTKDADQLRDAVGKLTSEKCKLTRDLNVALDNLNKANTTIDRLQGDINKLKQRIVVLEPENCRLKSELNNALDEIKKVTTELLQLRENESKLKQRIASLENENSNLKQNLDAALNELKGLSNAMKELQENEAKLKQKIAELESENTKLAEESNKLKSELQKLKEDQEKYAALQDQLNSLLSKIESLEKENAGLRGAMGDSDELARLRELEKMLRQQIADLQNDNDKLKKDIVALTAKIEDGSGDVSSLRGEIVTLQQRNAALEQENKKLKGDLDAALNSLRDAEKSLAQMKDENSKLKQRIAQLEAENAQLKKELDELRDLKQKLAQLEAENKKLKSDLDAAIQEAKKNFDELSRLRDEEAKLKQKLAQLEQENGKLKKDIEKYAADSESGGAAAQKLKDENNKLLQKISDLESQLEKLKKELEAALETAKKCARDAAALQEENAKLKQTLAQLEKDNANLKKDLEKAQTGTQQLSQLQNENAKQKNKISELENELANLKKKLEESETLKKNIADLNKKLEAALADAKAKEAENARLLEENKKLQQKIQDLEKQLAELRKRLQDAEAKAKEYDNLKQKLAEMEKLNASLKNDLESLAKGAKENDKLKDELDNLRAKLSQLEKENAQLKKDLEDALAAAAENQKLKDELTNLKLKLAQLESENATLKNNLDAALAESKNLKQKVNDLETALKKKEQECNDTIAALKAQFDRDIKELMRKNAESIAALQKEHEKMLKDLQNKYDQEMNSLKEALRAAKADIESLSAERDKLKATIEEQRRKSLEIKSKVNQVENIIESEKRKSKDERRKSKSLEKALEEEKRRSEDIRKASLVLATELDELKEVKPRTSKLTMATFDTFETMPDVIAITAPLTDKELKFFGREPTPSTQKKLNLQDSLMKMAKSGVESLEIEELQVVHTKICDCAANALQQIGQASGVLKPHEDNKLALLKKIASLEGDLLKKQKHAQQKVVAMQFAVKLEKDRLTDLRKSLDDEKRKNSDLLTQIGSQSKVVSNIKEERDIIQRQKSYHEQKLEHYIVAIEEERAKIRTLEDELDKEKNSVHHLKDLLDAERERARINKRKDTEALEIMRIKLEKTLNSEMMLKMNVHDKTRRIPSPANVPVRDTSVSRTGFSSDVSSDGRNERPCCTRAPPAIPVSRSKQYLSSSNGLDMEDQ